MSNPTYTIYCEKCRHHIANAFGEKEYLNESSARRGRQKHNAQLHKGDYAEAKITRSDGHVVDVHKKKPVRIGGAW